MNTIGNQKYSSMEISISEMCILIPAADLF